MKSEPFLQAKRLDRGKRVHVRIGQSSTIQVYRNVDSVGSRLIIEKVEAAGIRDSRPEDKSNSGRLSF